jgi:drug/metabolite transporter (DMT)-like permease
MLFGETSSVFELLGMFLVVLGVVLNTQVDRFQRWMNKEKPV